MAFNPDKFPLGPIWDGLTEADQTKYMNLAFGRLAPFGLGTQEHLDTETKEAAFSLYLRQLVDAQGAGDDITVPDFVREMLYQDKGDGNKNPSSLSFSGISADGTRVSTNTGSGVDLDDVRRLFYDWSEVGNTATIPLEKIPQLPREKLPDSTCL